MNFLLSENLEGAGGGGGALQLGLVGKLKMTVCTLQFRPGYQVVLLVNADYMFPCINMH